MTNILDDLLQIKCSIYDCVGKMPVEVKAKTQRVLHHSHAKITHPVILDSKLT